MTKETNINSSITLPWIEEAKKHFSADKPGHFTNYTHCEECAEHDETLRTASIDSIGMAELGNAGWDPMCFCSAEGMGYYFPALVRLSLDTANDGEFYFEQLLFHLQYDFEENCFLKHCSTTQRAFIAKFIWHMISTFPVQLEENMCASQALDTYEFWNSAVPDTTEE